LSGSPGRLGMRPPLGVVKVLFSNCNSRAGITPPWQRDVSAYRRGGCGASVRSCTLFPMEPVFAVSLNCRPPCHVSLRNLPASTAACVESMALIPRRAEMSAVHATRSARWLSPSANIWYRSIFRKRPLSAAPVLYPQYCRPTLSVPSPRPEIVNFSPTGVKG